MTDQATPLTLLVVEDDSIVRDTIELMCELWGYSVVSFSNGYQTQEWLSNEVITPPLPDLALLDIRMPGPDGFEIAEMIRLHPQLHNIGIILMTAWELPQTQREEVMTSSGADQLLDKPLPGMKELQAIIMDVLARRHTG